MYEIVVHTTDGGTDSFISYFEPITTADGKILKVSDRGNIDYRYPLSAVICWSWRTIENEQ